jgi:hypothetical protein
MVRFCAIVLVDGLVGFESTVGDEKTIEPGVGLPVPEAVAGVMVARALRHALERVSCPALAWDLRADAAEGARTATVITTATAALATPMRYLISAPSSLASSSDHSTTMIDPDHRTSRT